MNRTPDAIYEDLIEILQKANQELHGYTNNQQGMPAHLRGVAMEFANAEQLVAQLKDYANASAEDWEKELSGDISNGNVLNGSVLNGSVLNGGSKRTKQSKRTKRSRRNRSRKMK